MSDPGTPHAHPSPHRDRVSTPTLLLGLAVGPAAWILQQTLGYGASSYACFPSDAPRTAPAPNWPAERIGIAAASLLFLVVATAGVWIGYRAWRATREEKEGAHGALLEVGEGRSRFLAGCAVLTAALFCIAIVFDLAVAVSLPNCGTFGL